MAITTLDGVIAGMQAPRQIAKAVTGTMVAGRPWSTWALAGSPGAGSFDTTLNGVTLSSTSAMVNGQIPHVNPGSGNAYLARLSATATQAGVLILADRIWHNGGYTITSTSAQNSTTPTWPSRDVAGSTNGDGIILGLEISAATGAGTPTVTVSYTNQAGTGSRTGTNTIATVASSAAGSFYPISLQAGDTGVRSVQSLTLSATWTSGTMNLVAYRPIAHLELPGGLIPNALDALTGGMPRLYDGSVPWLIFVPNTTTTSNIIGSYIETHG
jgi:hypothetical protein